MGVDELYVWLKEEGGETGVAYLMTADGRKHAMVAKELEEAKRLRPLVEQVAAAGGGEFTLARFTWYEDLDTVRRGRG